VFWRLLLTAWSLLHAYVFWRAATVPAITRRVSRRALAVAGLGLWGSAFVLRAFARDAGGLAALLFELAVMHWLAILFLAALALLAVDLVTAFGWLWRGAAPALRGRALLVALLLAATALIQGLRPPVVSDHEVTLEGLPSELDGTTLVALSDLHLGELLGARWAHARIRQVEALSPDLVVYLGDLFEGHGDPDPSFSAALARVRPPLGVWGVTGNHDHHGGGTGDAFVAAGIRVLSDTVVEVAPGLVLAGVDDRSLRRAGPGGDALSSVLRGRPPGATVLLAHRPWQAALAARHGVGLMLSGHTHGGQVWPFGALVRSQYPLLAGRYQVGSLTAIVCRGTGTWGPRMRLWRPGEILRVTLRALPPAEQADGGLAPAPDGLGLVGELDLLDDPIAPLQVDHPAFAAGRDDRAQLHLLAAPVAEVDRHVEEMNRPPHDLDLERGEAPLGASDDDRVPLRPVVDDSLAQHQPGSRRDGDSRAHDRSADCAQHSRSTPSDHATLRSETHYRRVGPPRQA